MTVRDVLWGTPEDSRTGITDLPRLDREWLLSHVLGFPRLHLYLHLERPLSEKECREYKRLAVGRLSNVPLQYLVGSTSFLGHEIICRPGILIPRPETEILAQLAIMQLEMNFPHGLPLRVLDFGTGSGCLTVAIALGCDRATIVAMDRSPEALEIARENFEEHSLGARVQVIEGDGLRALEGVENISRRSFDMIVSNPPYIPTGDIHLLPPDVRDHEPPMALDGGPDGLEFMRVLAAEAPEWLRPGGYLLVEFGDGQGESVLRLFNKPGWGGPVLRKDLSGKDRLLIVSSRTRGQHLRRDPVNLDKWKDVN